MDDNLKDINSIPVDNQQNDSAISQTPDEVFLDELQETSSIQEDPQDLSIFTPQDVDNVKDPEIVMETSEEKTLLLPTIEEEKQPEVPPAWAIQLQESLNKLLDDFDHKLKYDAQKNSQVNKLYAENKEYRDNIIDKFKKKIILDVIEQIDD